jgi:predicted DNA-binding transcriptional regulator AlpA
VFPNPLEHWVVTVFVVHREGVATLGCMDRHAETHSTEEILPELLSRAQVQEILSISRQSLWRLVKQGALPAVYLDRRPRFLTEDVWQFVRSRRSTRR